MILSQWDWNVGKKVIADLGQWHRMFEWIEEPYVSPDGEIIAAIVKLENAAFSVCENGVPWENEFDKIWYLRFGPNRFPSALVSTDGMWSVAPAGNPWDNWYDFVWDLRFGADGTHITVAAVSDGQYFAATDGVAWHQKYPSLSSLTVSDDGQNSAAVVQTVAFNSGDIFKFQEGCYSAAVNGAPWEKNFLNLWEMSFSPDGRHLAAEARTTLYDYAIIVDGIPWDKSYASVWKPKFHPTDGAVFAPVKVAGGWTLARNGEIFWDKRFFQLWHHQFSADGENIAAIVAPEFGQRTIAINGNPWPIQFNNLVTDLVFSPDGQRTACTARTDTQWAVAADGRCWEGFFDMAWAPVFSPDSRHIAAKVEKNGTFYILVDEKPLNQEFSMVWDPVFSPDSTKLMVRGIDRAKKEAYCRYVFKLSDVLD